MYFFGKYVRILMDSILAHVNNNRIRAFASITLLALYNYDVNVNQSSVKHNVV